MHDDSEFSPSNDTRLQSSSLSNRVRHTVFIVYIIPLVLVRLTQVVLGLLVRGDRVTLFYVQLTLQ
eukprot:Awhi_evm1s9202